MSILFNMFPLILALVCNLICMWPGEVLAVDTLEKLGVIDKEPYVQPQPKDPVRADSNNVDPIEQPEIVHIDLPKLKNAHEEPSHGDSPDSKSGNKQDPPKSSNSSTEKQAESTGAKEVKNASLQSEPVLPAYKGEVIQSGALLRGFYVFLGLSVIVMVYFIFRSYRLRRGSQPSITVRKYGVTARRSDMEMRPLELDEEDDDTLFDIGTQNINR